MLPKNIETYGAIAVDVGVVNLRSEANFGGFERVVGRKSDHQDKDTAGIWTIGGAHDSCLPLEHVVALRTCRARRGGVSSKIMEFFVDSFEGHEEEEEEEGS